VVVGLRLRLALFLVGLLLAVQGLTAAAVYVATRGVLVEQGKGQLAESAALLGRQLDDRAERVADAVEVMSLDFPFRRAIASDDRATVLSTMRNHGRRVGAERMVLASLEGAVVTDTGGGLDGAPFPFPDLLDAAFADGRAAATAVLDGRAYWVVVLPILAPTPIAFVAAGVPLDDALLQDLQTLSGISKSVSLAVEEADGWRVVARAGDGGMRGPVLPAAGGALPPEPVSVRADGEESLVLARPLPIAEGSARVAAVLRFPLAEAIRPYLPVLQAVAALAAAGLLAALVGTVVVSGGVTRPIEALAATARRIEGGDLDVPRPPPRRDEIGQLAAAMSSMTGAIREREARIRHQATHDAATGLPNRAGFLAAVDGVARAAGGGHFAVIAVQPKRLREIGETLGLDWGDRTLLAAAERIAPLLPEGAAIGRVADDVIAAAQRCDGADATRVTAVRVAEALDQPLVVDGLALDASGAVGIAVFPEHGDAPEPLLRHARVALGAAAAAEPPVAAYAPETDPNRPERLSLMHELRGSIDAGHLKLYYQPKLDLASGRIDGAEALVRWFHPDRGFVPPDSFIPLAEETGTIRHLTRWGIATAARQAAAWRDAGYALRAAVNLSARDLADPCLPERVREELAARALPPESLALEITESAIMSDPEAALSVMRRLSEQGIELAVDDFGVGQSSLAYLRRLPVRELKIDKSFVTGLAGSADDRAIVRAVGDLGRSLGFSITAEGVEDGASLGILGDLGVHHAQGYHVARPMAPDAFAGFLEDGGWPAARAGACAPAAP